MKPGQKGRIPKGGILKLDEESREILFVTLDKFLAVASDVASWCTRWSTTPMNDIRQGTCPICGHNEIVEAKPRAETHHGRALLYIATKPSSTFFAAATQEVGEVSSYSCRCCDFTQLFTENTASLLIGEEHGTRLIVGPRAKDGAEPHR